MVFSNNSWLINKLKLSNQTIDNEHDIIKWWWQLRCSIMIVRNNMLISFTSDTIFVVFKAKNET